jgi:simple sugar transport system ATP-binding protein
VILARELSEPRDLVVFAEPTWGIDVGSTVDIHNRVVALRERGRAVLLISSDLDEILTLSDRILVMRQGRLAASYQRGVSRQELGGAMLLGASS